MTETLGGFELGRVHCCDCLEAMKQLPEGCVDLLLTDPPYGHNNQDGDLQHVVHGFPGKLWRNTEDDERPISNDGPEANDLFLAMLTEARRLLAPGACCCCCCGGGGPDPQFSRWSLWLDEIIGFKMCVVWDKGGLGMGWHYRRCWECILVGQKPGAACKWYGGNDTPNIIRNIGKIIPAADQHPTVKPVALMEWFITKHTLPGDLVCDPFAGSGTTGVACVQTGRRFLGFEIEQKWADLANERIAAARVGLPFKEYKAGQGTLFGDMKGDAP